MRDLFVTIVVFGSLPIILSEPYIGVLMWSWIGYMNPHRLSWGFARDFPFAMIVAITTLFALMVSTERKRVPMTREVVILTIFIVWMAVTTIFAKYPGLAFEHLIKILKIELMTYITMMLIYNRKRLDLLLWVIVLSLGFYGVKGGIFTILTGGVYHVRGPVGTFIGGNNEVGLALIMTLPLMRYLQLRARRRWVRLAWTGAMLLTGIAILGTQSRGALLGVTAMGIFLLWKSRRRFVLLLGMAIAIPIALSIMPQKWYNRMATIQTYQQDASAEGRINAWRFATNVALDHPVVGGGLQIFAYRRAAHSIYFEVLGEHGFPGLALFLLLGIATWRGGSRVIRQTKEIPELWWARDMASMLQVSLVGFAVSGAFLSLAYFDLYYHLIAIMVMCQIIVRQELPAHESATDAAKAGPTGAWPVPTPRL